MNTKTQVQIQDSMECRNWIFESENTARSWLLKQGFVYNEVKEMVFGGNPNGIRIELNTRFLLSEF